MTFKLSSIEPSVFNPINNLNIETLINGESLALTQQPSGLGVLNALQIEYGPPQGTASDPVQLLLDGTVQVNETGTYIITTTSQFGRTLGAGQSQLLFDFVFNGLSFGRSVHGIINSSNTTQYITGTIITAIPAGASFFYRLTRDLLGSDSGGLFGFTPSVEVGQPNFSPTATILIQRWV